MGGFVALYNALVLAHLKTQDKSAIQRQSATGYYTGEWTFNGGLELWLRSDGTYLWRQSLFYCSPDGNGNIGWSNDESGKWSIRDRQVKLQRTSGTTANAYVENLYFARHRIFSVAGVRGERALVSGSAEDMVALKEADASPVSPGKAIRVDVHQLPDYINRISVEDLKNSQQPSPSPIEGQGG
jgi:hypothetical protein